jgi:hypothetical protein
MDLYMGHVILVVVGMEPHLHMEQVTFGFYNLAFQSE